MNKNLKYPKIYIHILDTRCDGKATYSYSNITHVKYDAENNILNFTKASSPERISEFGRKGILLGFEIKFPQKEKKDES